MPSPQNDLSIFGQFADALETSWRARALPHQIEPDGDWTIWLICAGRGAGKTRAGSEWILEQVSAGRRRLGLIGPTSADVRDVMIEGESGILACAPDWNRPVYEPSKRRLTWPNGAIATTYSAEEGQRLRGPQHDALWADELAAWTDAQMTWDMAQFGLRLGARPRALVTTTPRPTKLLRDLIAREGRDVVITRASTRDNAANLATSFLATVENQYGGTRLGRQELEGELLTDVPGALWSLAMIEEARVRREDVPEMRRIVVAIDPAVTSGEDADETGIIVAGLGVDGVGYVLEDRSGRYSPTEWAREAVAAYHKHRADRIVAETNQGGELVRATVEVVDANVAYKGVHASRGKYTRAEPVSALFEQRRVKIAGAFSKLEDQMTTFQPGASKSPDRLDACVYALTELMLSTTGDAIIEFYRLQVETNGRPGKVIEGQAQTLVRLVAPEGVSTVLTLSGESLNIPEDRKIMVTAADAAPLLAAGFTQEDQS
ncbi:putative phage terminase large subunit-like protein [Rhodoblastus acidophilus]|uniref:DNA-packaging protein n=1 Tax=Rhodoblastus acidophilus TaxID=1074 RepID=UPI002224A31B|nr:terminase family protein [Rhodoblastus acidophilus]MCW2285693.1 putative phage terminase large subunit-like protein [Rhodoblastus acidophilus]MCW2333065.1 putative phage terminase large subunit-like protein [Rhodoblastus acidophilus]